ncbi:MAG: hypothetical protein OXH73_19765 [Caldilineaceae bacterium]|nr:hypothetical protein [Caldilineaceae bacterium]
MEEICIQLYTDPETKRRIELRATKYDVAIAEYCLTVIQRQLEEDELLETYRVDIPGTSRLDERFFSSLQALQEKIKVRRGGQPIDIDRIMSEMRDERENEIHGLR